MFSAFDWLSATAAYTDPTSDPDVHRRQLDEALAILAEAGVPAEPIPAIGNPAAEIISAVESRHVDLIVIGRQGMSVVRQFLLGSVADRVVRHATCSSSASQSLGRLSHQIEATPPLLDSASAGVSDLHQEQVRWLPLERDDSWSLVGFRLLT
ncbi:MAG TPA: universal stress protein [Solirubrobacteraceae bacterium]